LIAHLKSSGIYAVFHYISLHSSPFYKDKHEGGSLPHTDRYSDTLLRLPFYHDLQKEDVALICKKISSFYA